jgi:hypothetical protein
MHIHVHCKLESPLCIYTRALPRFTLALLVASEQKRTETDRCPDNIRLRWEHHRTAGLKLALDRFVAYWLQFTDLGCWQSSSQTGIIQQDISLSVAGRFCNHEWRWNFVVGRTVVLFSVCVGKLPWVPTCLARSYEGVKLIRDEKIKEHDPGAWFLLTSAPKKEAQASEEKVKGPSRPFGVMYSNLLGSSV